MVIFFFSVGDTVPVTVFKFTKPCQDYVRTLEYLHDKGGIYVTCSGLINTGNAAREDSEQLQLTSRELEEILRKSVAYCNLYFQIFPVNPGRGWLRLQPEDGEKNYQDKNRILHQLSRLRCPERRRQGFLSLLRPKYDQE